MDGLTLVKVVSDVNGSSRVHSDTLLFSRKRHFLE